MNPPFDLVKALVLPLTLCAFSLSASAQIPNLLPGDSTPTDVEEVEDFPSDDDVLPAYSGSVDATVREAEILTQQLDELSLRHHEIRRAYLYGVSFAAGETIPWQNFTLEAFTVDDGADTIGIVVGTGGFHDEGRVDDRHFDLDFTTRGTALTRRFYIDVLEPLSFMISAGAVVFEGKVDPSGSDDLLATENEKLQSTFRATGAFLGMTVSLDALWAKGYFIEWSPIGLRHTWLVDKELSRDSDAAKEAMTGKLGTTGIFGLVNLKFGMLL